MDSCVSPHIFMQLAAQLHNRITWWRWW